MKRKFRNFQIKRTCTKNYENYSSFKPYLKNDFFNRCAYCNLLEGSITTPFEVDHFIPRDTFKEKWPECDTLYDNLMYSCKKCNIAKSNQYSGDIENRKIINDYFYNPVVDDFGKIFYRNDAGGIDSDDLKAKEMIEKLKLYRPIHNMAWLCEILNETLEKLKIKIEMVDRESEQGKLLIQAKEVLSDYYILCQQVFTENYNNDKFII